MKNRTKHFKYSSIVTWLALLSLVASMFTGIITGDTASAQSNASSLDHSARKSADRVSPDLRERAQGAKNLGLDETVKIILQVKGPLTARLNGVLNRNGVHIKATFQQFNSYAVELPMSVISELETYSEVLYVSLDKEMKSLGHLSLTTGADAVRTQTVTSPLG